MLNTHLQDIDQLKFGMDVIIISVTSTYEADFWQKRLDQMRGQIIEDSAQIITVCEDWQHGAGNALGTLYAFQKANEKSREKLGTDLLDLMAQNQSVAIYHTAGKGTRLSPMTGCEYNSKSRIKLPSLLHDKKQKVPLTLLEAVIKQTSILAPTRKGRLSVFWGDQIFIPENELHTPHAEIDLLIKPIKGKPSQQEWLKNDYSKYGLVIVDSNQALQQLEKFSYDDFAKFALQDDEILAFSLGSFSLSKDILNAFLSEFQVELIEKNTSLDSDPHLWMPLSLSEKLYIEIMNRKTTTFNAKEHYARMQAFKHNFKPQKPAFFGASNTGPATLWWDFGNLKSYYENSLKLLNNDQEAQYLKKFFKVSFDQNPTLKANLKVENSLLIDCRIQKGHIQNSVLIKVHAHEAEIKDSVLLSSCAQSIAVNQGILYNCLENGKINVLPNQIRADYFSKDNGHLQLYNTIHPHLSWDQPVEGNPLSFKALHEINQEVNPAQGQHLAQKVYNKIKQAVFDLQK